MVSGWLKSREEIINLHTYNLFFKASSTDMRAGNLLYLLKVKQKQQYNPVTPEAGTIYIKFRPDPWGVGMAQDTHFHKLSYGKSTIKESKR